jgi:hypothetical protein
MVKISACHAEECGFKSRLFRNMCTIFTKKLLKIPQFDLLCFGVLVWSLIIILSLFYFYLITYMIPFFVEIKKFRIKKNKDDNMMKQTVIINKNLLFNSKIKKIIL